MKNSQFLQKSVCIVLDNVSYAKLHKTEKGYHEDMTQFLPILLLVPRLIQS